MNRINLNVGLESGGGVAVEDAETGQAQGVAPGAAPAQGVKRDATAADGQAAMKASVHARFQKKRASAALKQCFANMRAGDLEGAIDQLVVRLRGCQSYVQEIVALPNGVNIKGGSSKQDLIIDICGQEAAKERSARIKKSMDAYGLADLKAKD